MGEVPASVANQHVVDPVPTDDLPVVSDHPVPSPVPDAVSLVPEPVSSVSPNSVSHHLTKPHRIFLDICCGHRGPLSSAIHSLGGDVVQFDILLHSSDDLLDDKAYDKLMKLASSGLVAYCACSLSCCECSRLKLKPGARRR